MSQPGLKTKGAPKRWSSKDLTPAQLHAAIRRVADACGSAPTYASLCPSDAKNLKRHLADAGITVTIDSTVARGTVHLRYRP